MGLLLTAVNLVFSALVIVGLPIVVTGHLGFDQATGNRLYGYTQGALAAGGLLGGLLAGMIGHKFKVSHGARLIFWCTATLLPIGLALQLPIGPLTAYLVISGFCVVMMMLSTLLSVVMISYVQKITPATLIGKVMALLMCLVMCGNPIGQVLYGVLFEHLSASVAWIYFGAFTVCLGLCAISRFVFRQLSDEVIAS